MILRATAVASLLAFGVALSPPGQSVTSDDRTLTGAAAAAPVLAQVAWHRPILKRTAAPTYAATTVTAVRADADWILRAQLPDGAIARYTDQVSIGPYLSHFAAVGLAQATRVTGDRSYVAAAWRWLDWYAAHMDAQGFVEDYDVVNGTPVANGFKDSTDSYAGMFLVAVRAAVITSGDTAHMSRLAPAIRAAVGAIEATQDADGLTWAKPEWRVKYLMDQAETYAGLRSAADLGRRLNDAALTTRATNDANRLQAGVDRLWQASTSSYDWAVHGDGARIPTDWRLLYSDATQQAWAVAFGLVPATRAAEVMTRFLQAQPAWDQPQGTSQYTDGAHSTGYWVPVGWAEQRVGRVTEATTAASRITSAATAANRAWPFTPSDAGQLIVLRSNGRDLLLP